MTQRDNPAILRAIAQRMENSGFVGACDLIVAAAEMERLNGEIEHLRMIGRHANEQIAELRDEISGLRAYS